MGVSPRGFGQSFDLNGRPGGFEALDQFFKPWNPVSRLREFVQSHRVIIPQFGDWSRDANTRGTAKYAVPLSLRLSSPDGIVKLGFLDDYRRLGGCFGRRIRFSLERNRRLALCRGGFPRLGT